MRKITEAAVRAFIGEHPINIGNTAVTVDTVADGLPIVRMYLHGNLIAERCNGVTRGTLAGWPTPTTRDRLNGLALALTGHYVICQSAHRQIVTEPGEPSREVTDHAWFTIDREPALLRRQAS